MIDLIITHPKWPRLKLRLLAYKPSKHCNPDQLLSRVQVMKGDKPLAEDPVMESWETEASVAAWIANHVADGYRFETFDMSEIHARDAAREAYRASLNRSRRLKSVA